MTSRQIAILIPDNDRKMLLEDNVISNAVAVGSNREMQILTIIWKEYVEPTLILTCNNCYARILKNFRELQPALIELEKEDKLL